MVPPSRMILLQLLMDKTLSLNVVQNPTQTPLIQTKLVIREILFQDGLSRNLSCGPHGIHPASNTPTPLTPLTTLPKKKEEPTREITRNNQILLLDLIPMLIHLVAHMFIVARQIHSAAYLTCSSEKRNL